MGLITKMRAELVDIVEWIDDGRHTLVWRFPRFHNQIKQGARLIVRPGQEAVLVHQGRLADVFRPGTHVLQTGNLPVLSTLQGWKHGFDSPFKAEVYFVTTRQVTDLRWGTPHPVMLRDPDFGPIRLRAFGTYALRCRDAKVLMQQLVGTDASFEAEEIEVLLRSIIAGCFADLLAESGLSVMDLASNYTELGGKLRRMVLERIDDEYGLDLPQLWIVNFSLPEEVERALDARSSQGILGDLDSYQRYQVGASMPVAAANPAGGLAGAGLGVGMGMAVAGRMMPGIAQPERMPGVGAPGAPAGGRAAGPGGAPAGPAAPPPAPPAWYVAEAGHSRGPFTPEQLAAAAREGRLTAATLVWTAGMSGWTAAGSLPELAAILGAGPPPPPPPVPPEAGE